MIDPIVSSSSAPAVRIPCKRDFRKAEGNLDRKAGVGCIGGIQRSSCMCISSAKTLTEGIGWI